MEKYRRAIFHLQWKALSVSIRLQLAQFFGPVNAKLPLCNCCLFLKEEYGQCAVHYVNANM